MKHAPNRDFYARMQTFWTGVIAYKEQITEPAFNSMPENGIVKKSNHYKQTNEMNEILITFGR